MNQNEDIKIVYIDGVDWQHEVEATDATVWPTKESILERTPCAWSCGVVRCELKMLEWVHPQRLRNSKVEDGVNVDIVTLWEGHIERYKQRIEGLQAAINRVKSEKIEEVGEFTVVSHCERVMVSGVNAEGLACLNKRKGGTIAFFYREEGDNEKVEGMTLEGFKQECKQRWGLDFTAKGFEV